jgi:hypothetical protein
MSSMQRLWSAISAIVVGAGVVACTGGGGSLSEGMRTWESAPGSQDRAQNSNEGAPAFGERAPGSQDGVAVSAEPGPGAQSGAGGFDCSGTYTCQEDGDDDLDTVVLTSVNGVCSISSGNAGLVFGADGSLTAGGERVGSWKATANGFTATVGKDTVTCTKGDRTGGRSGEDSPPPTVPPSVPQGD